MTRLSFTKAAIKRDFTPTWSEDEISRFFEWYTREADRSGLADAVLEKLANHLKASD